MIASPPASTSAWSPRIVGELNGQHVKLAKLRGAFVWHHHEEEDELFLVLEGRLAMHFRDRVVPRGVEHLPVAEPEAHVLLFEPVTTLNTGNVRSDRTVEHLERLHSEKPHRFTFISPASGEIAREEVCDRLASTMAALYRVEADATGQPMGGSEPFAAVRNAIEHYRVDDILVSTLAGRESKWLADGLIERIEEITDDPVTHFEAGAGARETAGAVPVGAAGEGGEA